ncbi:MAG: DUF1211 domain-containing protein [Spartobacteria bacterium]|nr:DUF1211 domain-containing protein [Spartobacteria bacterium]
MSTNEQPREQDVDSNLFMSTERIMTLTDGIFSIAMTLLVLSIDVPSPAQVPAGLPLQRYLLRLWPQFGNYVLSFFLLAIFWIGLHRSSYSITRTNHQHLWINIAMLMFVCLVPFSASLSGEYSNSIEAQFIFNANMLVIGLIYLGNWVYATADHRLVAPSMSTHLIHGITCKLAMFPAIAFCAMIVALFHPVYASWIYILTPFAMRQAFALHQKNAPSIPTT